MTGTLSVAVGVTVADDAVRLKHGRPGGLLIWINSCGLSDATIGGLRANSSFMNPAFSAAAGPPPDPHVRATIRRDTPHRLWISGLLLAYAVVVITPVALAAWQGFRRRPLLDELSSALAMAGFAMLLMEFVLSGRFRAVSGAIGMDTTMRFHQLMARVLTVFLVVHPFLYTLPMAERRPWDPDGAASLGLTLPGALSGFLAWGVLLAVVGLALFRDKAAIRYESWRLGHGLGAAAVAIFGLHHTLEVGRYSGASYAAGFWIAATVVAMFSLFVVYFVRPLWQRANPWRVTELVRCAERTWTLRIEPEPGTRRLRFDAGQFVWVKFYRALFRITEHPFSMSSSPSQLPVLEFTVKESGDFTGRIGDLKPGTPAFIDGPHGNFSLRGRSASGLVFIAGGVGIAPIIAILRDLYQAHDPRPIILIYGNRHAGQIAFAEELERLQRELRLRVVHVLSEPPAGWSGLTGQLDRANLARCLPEKPASGWLYFVCGPTPMQDSVEDTLEQVGVPVASIVSERFRYDSGRVTRRERRMLATCAAVAGTALVAALAFALR